VIASSQAQTLPLTMADAQTPQQLIQSLGGAKLYDLTGLVAVITGGSTVACSQTRPVDKP